MRKQAERERRRMRRKILIKMNKGKVKQNWTSLA